jgi:hypothetical protein
MIEIERMQSGVRLEQRTLKVSRAPADLLDMSLGDLIERVLLHAFDGKTPFSEETLERIVQLKAAYGLDLTAEDTYWLATQPDVEEEEALRLIISGN